ncbi:hypothetical protein XENOCAPTIV_014634, partial [Xenoophorus captivus]
RDQPQAVKKLLIFLLNQGQTDRSLAMEALYRGQLSSLPSGWRSHKLCLNSGIELRFRRGACLWYICVSKEIRSSLVLSMLQQMLAEDKADMVREAGFELMLLSLGDPSERVVNAVHQCDFSPQQGEHGLDEHKLHVFLSALQSLIPPLFAVVLQNAPFTSRVKLHEDIPAIEDASAGNGILTKATVPIYATGVLTCYNQLLVGFLEDVMTTLSLSHAPLDSLKASFVELG